MAIYECPACGHKCQCPLKGETYEEYGFEFWCFGDKLLHGSTYSDSIRRRVNNYMEKYFSPSGYNHPPIQMKCKNKRAHNPLQK